MARTADIVIIGGGLIGCATAYHLAKMGVRKVVVVEKSTLGSGSSGRSSAIIRCHYTTEQLTRIALKALEFFKNFRELVGGQAGLCQCGYVVLAGPENEVPFKANVAMHQSVGVNVELITPDELSRRLPNIHVEDVAAAAWEYDSGYADPAQTLNAFAARARDMGVEFLQMTEVTGLKVGPGDRLQGVETTAGEISAPIVVDCAGPWASRVAAQAGASVPVEAHREEIVIFQRPPAFGQEHPVVSDLVALQYLRPEVGGCTLAGNSDHSHPEVVDPDRYNTEPSPEGVELAMTKAIHRFPVLEDSVIHKGYTGCYEVTPDYNPVIDRVPGVEGFFVSAGYSGHGFKLTPVVAEMTAELVLYGAHKEFDVNFFRLSRFAEGKPIRGPHPYKRGATLR